MLTQISYEMPGVDTDHSYDTPGVDTDMKCDFLLITSRTPSSDISTNLSKKRNISPFMEAVVRHIY